eukprot:SM000173S03031  [mRNA]  locus=s173:193351:199506:- [translate_table: standard]
MAAKAGAAAAGVAAAAVAAAEAPARLQDGVAAAGAGLDRRTVFVRSVAFATNEAALEEAFAEVGPVRKCFLVRQKGAKDHRGFGFVQFALPEDAERAAQIKHGALLGGRKLKVEVAKKRAPFEQRRQQKLPPVGQAAQEVSSELPAGDLVAQVHSDSKESGQAKKGQREANGRDVADKTAEEGKDGAKPVRKKKLSNAAKKNAASQMTSQRQRPARTVVFGGIINDSVRDGLLKNVEAIGSLEDAARLVPEEQLKICGLIKDGCKPPVLEVVFTSVQLATKAVEVLHGQQFQGATIWARQLGGEIKEAELASLFSRAGTVREVTIPGIADNKQAVTLLNGLEIHKRPVAVDWAVPKAKYEVVAAQLQETAEQMQEIGGTMNSDEDGTYEGIEENVDTSEVGTTATPAVTGSPQAQSRTSMDEVSRGSRMSGPSVDAKQESRKSDAQLASENRQDLPENEDEVVRKVLLKVLSSQTAAAPLASGLSTASASFGKGGARAEPADEEEAEEAEEADDGGRQGEGEVDEIEDLSRKSNPASTSRMGSSRDEVTGATVFMRQLPAGLKVADLRALFSAYGEVRSCRLVLHPVTKRPKGTAFLEFTRHEDAEAAVQASKKQGVYIMGKALSVDMAVDKQEAVTLARSNSQHERERDRRNLYLLEDGRCQNTITSNVTGKADVTRELGTEKQLKLASPNFYVSPTRLLVHNIPKNMTEKELRILFLDAVKSRATKQCPTIKQVKILADSSKKDAKGAPRSRGAGFVEFVEHQHALVALRVLNNNPEIFGPECRPIIEFAIENSLILKQRATLKTKAKLAEANKKKVVQAASSNHLQEHPLHHGKSTSHKVVKGKQHSERTTGRGFRENHAGKRKRQENVEVPLATSSKGGTSTQASLPAAAVATKVSTPDKTAAGQHANHGKKGQTKTRREAVTEVADTKKLVSRESSRVGNQQPALQEVESRRAKKRKVGEDTLEQLVADYRKKLVAGNGPVSGKQLQQRTRQLVNGNDIRRWYE